MIKLIVGLGNPGPEYELSRHNIGMLALDNLSFESQLNWTKKFKGLYAKREDKFFLKPQTFMNLSGESVVEIMNFFKIKIDEILIVHDELDFQFGKIQFKDGGGTAGHNGLKSILKCLGTSDFKRLRLGIGRPEHGSVSDSVLSSFKDSEISELESLLKNAAVEIEKLI